jgi:hypothetical protein
MLLVGRGERPAARLLTASGPPDAADADGLMRRKAF